MAIVISIEFDELRGIVVSMNKIKWRTCSQGWIDKFDGSIIGYPYVNCRYATMANLIGL